MLTECSRVLAPGGCLILADLFSALLLPTLLAGRRGKARTKRRATQLVTAAGLRSPQWHRLYAVIILHGMRVFTIINGQYFKASCHYLPVHSDHSSTHSSSARLARYLPPFISSRDQAQSWPDGKLSAFADPIARQVYMSVTDGTRKELPPLYGVGNAPSDTARFSCSPDSRP